MEPTNMCLAIEDAFEQWQHDPELLNLIILGC